MAFDPHALEIGAHYTRPQLAKLWGYASHAAISKGVFTPSRSGYIILFVTREKQASLTQYDDFLNGDILHWEGEKGHGSDMRIARAHEYGEEIHLFYRDIHHTPFIYFGQVLTSRFRQRLDGPSRFEFQLTHDLGAQDDIRRKAAELEALPATEREAIIKARIGQGRFREGLLQLWRGCAVTDVRHPDLLRASHIKPWRWSSNDERLDPHNGLLLLPHYDHLFDRGYIAFDDAGTLLRSPAILTLPPERLGINPNARLRRLEPEHVPFLEYHFEQVFLGSAA
jgi:putative restriction endonuclease